MIVDPKVVVKAKRGRPRKADIAAKKKGNRNAIGRPKGDAARINELKARLLATSGDKVISKVIEIALEDGHPVQSAALKMCMDRVLPISYFDKKNDTGGRNAVSITITGVGGDTTIVGNSGNDDTYEGEYDEVE
jgi:hypothetical protein|tara:strand:+ start:218 stop:619 length:402 start_codon:yes stop_codon:yes gene_type:complete